MTDQNVPYLAVIVIVMFLAGCVLIVVSLGDRLRERVRWFQPCGRKNRSTAAKLAINSATSGLIGRATSIRGLITFRKPLSAGLDADLCGACQC